MRAIVCTLLAIQLVACGEDGPSRNQAPQSDTVAGDDLSQRGIDAMTGEVTLEVFDSVSASDLGAADTEASDLGGQDSGAELPPQAEVSVDTTAPQPECLAGEACEAPGDFCAGSSCETSCVCAPSGVWACGVLHERPCVDGMPSCTSSGGCEACSCVEERWECLTNKAPAADDPDAALYPIATLPLDCSAMVEATGPKPLQRRWIEDAVARDAICNDGSPGAYYYRRGEGDNVNKWLIYLKSGAACDSYCSCRERWLTEGAEKMSSTCWESEMDADGIFNPAPSLNPDFHDWTIVYVRYCTSDSHLGNVAEVPELGDLVFRGHRVVMSVVEDLEDASLHADPNLKDATHVLMAGSSAGSQGVRHYFDWMAERMGPDVDVRGLLDAALRPDLAYEPQSTGKNAYKAAVLNPWVDASCLAATQSVAACLTHTWTLLNHVTTPYFSKMSQKDAVVLSSVGTDSPVAEAFATDVRALMDPANGHFPEGTGLFSKYGTSHVDLLHSYFYASKALGYSFQEILSHWYWDKQPEAEHPRVIIEYP